MKAASLFSGIGAPETAIPEWDWLWCAEIEKFPSAVLATRHPRSINLGDVTAHDFCDRALGIGKPDVIVFGSPCQSYSVAGKRLGLDDPRGNLALVAMGIIARLAPRWFVFENVPGLLSSSEGRDFGLFLRAVDELGYSGAWASLDAQWFGVAQRRERLFFVGCAGDWRSAAAVLFEPASLCGNHPPRREKGQGTAPTISARTEGGGGLGTDFDCDGGLISLALKAKTAGASHCPTQGSNNFRLHNCVTSGWAVRRLTPTECEFLQGFPDGYTAVPYRGKSAADGPRYKALGNSQAIPVMRWILSRIDKMERQGARY